MFTPFRLLLLALLPVSFDFQVTALRVSEIKCKDHLDWQSKRRNVLFTLNQKMIFLEPLLCMDGIGIIAPNSSRASIKEFPHQALLGYYDNATDWYEFRCGGSLISERFVLTAAHCGTPQIVRCGEDDINEEGYMEIDVKVEAFYKHPNYTLKASYHDIALVKLKTDLHKNSRIRPACLWTNTVLNLSSVIATGFGQTEFAGTGSKVLLKVELEFMPKELCEEKFKHHRMFQRGILDEQLCVGSQQGGEDTCQGDSGGPIQTVTSKTKCINHIVGVTSMGTSCGIGKAENSYTQVASYLDWIEDTVWPGERERIKFNVSNKKTRTTP